MKSVYFDNAATTAPRPEVIEAMHAALIPRKELYANGKYVVRVINRALNQLEGTSRQVD